MRTKLFYSKQAPPVSNFLTSHTILTSSSVRFMHVILLSVLFLSACDFSLSSSSRSTQDSAHDTQAARLEVALATHMSYYASFYAQNSSEQFTASMPFTSTPSHSVMVRDHDTAWQEIACAEGGMTAMRTMHVVDTQKPWQTVEPFQYADALAHYEHADYQQMRWNDCRDGARRIDGAVDMTLLHADTAAIQPGSVLQLQMGGNDGFDLPPNQQHFLHISDEAQASITQMRGELHQCMFCPGGNLSRLGQVAHADPLHNLGMRAHLVNDLGFMRIELGETADKPYTLTTRSINATDTVELFKNGRFAFFFAMQSLQACNFDVSFEMSAPLRVDDFNSPRATASGSNEPYRVTVNTTGQTFTVEPVHGTLLIDNEPFADAAFDACMQGLQAFTGSGLREPMPEALAALTSDAHVAVYEKEAWITFAPVATTPKTGLILYPGGNVDHRSYAPLARDIAAQGFWVSILDMPIDDLRPMAASDIMQAYTEIQTWAVGGHSLGGSIAAMFANMPMYQVDGLVLWASYPDTSTDLSAHPALQVVSIYGEHDDIVTPAQIQERAHLLPNNTRLIAIPGANHAQFGWYGDQPGDGQAEIDRTTQQQSIVFHTLEHLRNL